MVSARLVVLGVSGFGGSVFGRNKIRHGQKQRFQPIILGKKLNVKVRRKFYFSGFTHRCLGRFRGSEAAIPEAHVRSGTSKDRGKAVQFFVIRHIVPTLTSHMYCSPNWLVVVLCPSSPRQFLKSSLRFARIRGGNARNRSADPIGGNDNQSSQ